MTLNILIVLVVVALAIIFLLIEIFLLPGISIAGIAGAALLIGGVAYAYMFLGSTEGTITLIGSLVLLAVAFVWLVKSKSLQKIGLKANIDDTVDNSELLKIKPGDTGIAISRLNPIGKVMINDVVVEGKSIDGDFINEESEIEVVQVDTYHVIVKQKK